jgi:hypothetical protein
MRILLDECLPRPLKRAITGHTTFTVPEYGWAGTKNGALLRLAEQSFDVFITADQNVQYQQNLQSATLCMVVLVAPDTRLATLLPLIPKLLDALTTIQPGQVVHITE